MCGKEKFLEYKYYVKNVKNQNYYCCSQKCSQNKTKVTNNKIYGTDSASQNEKIKEKIKEKLVLLKIIHPPGLLR